MIDPSTEYSGQIDTSDPTGYPYGKPKNVSVSGDGTGTPLEAKWLSDVFGLFQALMAEAGLTPSGTPDKVGASQLLTAIHYRRMAAQWTFNNTLYTPGTKIGLVADISDAAFTLASDEVELVVGTYEVSVEIDVTSADTANPSQPYVSIEVGGSAYAYAESVRYSASTSQTAFLKKKVLVEIATPASEKISVKAQAFNTTVVTGILSIVRVK